MLLQFRDLGVTSWPFVVLRRSSWPFVDHSFTFVSDKSGLRPPRRGGSFESETGFVSDKSGLRLPRHSDETGFVSDKWGPCPAGQIIRE